LHLDILRTVVGSALIIINYAILFRIFKPRRGRVLTIGALAVFCAVYYTALGRAGYAVPNSGTLHDLAHLPLVLLLFEGKPFRKAYTFLLLFFLTMFQFVLAQTLGRLLESPLHLPPSMISGALLIVLFSVYLYMMLRFVRPLLTQLFVYGRTSEWALYSGGAILSVVVLVAIQSTQNSDLFVLLSLAFILWSFATLCFVIISTTERIRQSYEAAQAQDIVSAGREHYAKMSELREEIRILRHDYKYHLNTIHKLLLAGNAEEAEKYLSDIGERFVVNSLYNFCENPVLNALLSGYAERCETHSIRFRTQLAFPEHVSIPNYDMSVILGNLLENAVSACIRGVGKREITLAISTHGEHITIMVGNTFNTSVSRDELAGSGLGLRSISGVAQRYSGNLMTDIEGDVFKAYVLLRV